MTDEVQTGDPQSHAKGPEIFIGLIGAVGTDLYRIREHLKQELRRANYTPEIIHLSKLMMDLDNLEYLVANDKGPEDDRIDKFMDAGDAIRDSISRGDAVVLLGIGKIQDIREENQPTSAGSKREGELADRQRSREIRPLNRRAYIFHSLKHPEEVRTLRRVYGAAFIAISVYSPRNVRKQTLCERIARSRKEYNSEKFASRADELIEKDEKEVGDDFGQNVRDTFPEGDVFVDTTDIETIPAQIARLVNILFGYPYVTPTVDEYGMFHAKAAAMRSADLSRQVGAVITTADGEIIAAGCNEVPKAGGGSVWEGREEDKGKDYRDHTLGYDSTARMKHETIAEIFERLKPDWLASELRDLSPQELAADVELAEDILRQRLVRRDSSAIPALIEKLRDRERGHWWWFYARHIWSPELTQVLDETLAWRRDHVAHDWGQAIEEDWSTREMIMRLPIREAERLMLKHWEHLKFSTQFVQAALYVGTPELCRCARASIASAPDPASLFKHLSQHWGVREIGQPGITRESQILVLEQYLDLIGVPDLMVIAEVCNDLGWFELRRRWIDQRINNHRLAWSAEGAPAQFDSLLKNRRYYFLGWEIEDALKTGVCWDEFLNAMRSWFGDRQSFEALQLLAWALAYKGSRRDLSALRTYPGVPPEAAEALITDVTFVVNRRTPD